MQPRGRYMREFCPRNLKRGFLINVSRNTGGDFKKEVETITKADLRGKFKNGQFDMKVIKMSLWDRLL
jgi:hypothetical protein